MTTAKQVYENLNFKMLSQRQWQPLTEEKRLAGNWNLKCGLFKEAICKQCTVVLWSNVSCIRSGGQGFKSHCCRVAMIQFFQCRIPSIFISRKEMESRGRREETSIGNLISWVAIKQFCQILTSFFFFFFF